MNIDAASTALIVVDAQLGFVTQQSERALPQMTALLEGWHDTGALVVLTQFLNQPGSAYVRLIGWSKMMPEDPAVALHPTVAAAVGPHDVVVTKNGYTALIPTVLELLATHGVTDIVVAGLDTESCVLATVLGAFEIGITPWLVTDACASHAGPAEHQAGLLVAGRYVGLRQLVTTADVLAALQTDRLPRTASA